MNNLKPLLVLIVLIAASGVSTGLSAASYRAMALGGVCSAARGINDAGQIVGGARAASGAMQATIWQGGGMSLLGLPEGAFQSSAIDVNCVGQIVCSTSSGGYVYRDNQWIRVINAVGDVFTQPSDINDAGVVVGTYETRSGAYRPFTWQNGLFSDKGQYGWGNAISNAGTIYCGGYSPFSADRAYAIYPGGNPAFVADLGGISSALGCDESDSLVVGRSNRAPGTSAHPFLTENGSATDLGLLANTSRGEAVGVNSGRQVIGNCYFADGSSEAFLWQDGCLVQLPVLDGCVSSYACDINNYGQIVGYSTDSTGLTHAVLWVVPEPSSVLVLLCGIGGLSGAALRRRKLLF